MFCQSYSQHMKKKKPKLKAFNRSRIIKILGGLLGGGLLINGIEQLGGLEGVHQVLDLSGLIVENVLDKSITLVELLIELGK